MEHRCFEPLQYLYFDIGSDPKIIIIETWSSDRQTNPEVAIEVVEASKVVERDFDLPLERLKHVVNEEKNKWRPNYPGRKRLEIMPFNVNYKQNARYYIETKYTPKSETSHVFISLKLVDVDPIVTARNKRVIKGLSLANDLVLLHYTLKDIRNSYLFLEVSQKENIQIYLSSPHQYVDGDILNDERAHGDCPMKHQ